MLPTSLAELRERWDAGERFRFFLFYGHKPPESGVDASCFSQWFSLAFDVEGTTYRTAEHWMMAEKARLFRDDEMLEQILASETPRDAKALGRKVSGFDPKTWDEHKFEIVRKGNHAKFSRHTELRDFLISTKENVRGSKLSSATTGLPASPGVMLAAEERASYEVRSPESSVREQPEKYQHAAATTGVILVEAAGRDRIWGIGLGTKNPKSHDPMQWRGQNLLGFALTQVREDLAAGE